MFHRLMRVGASVALLASIVVGAEPAKRKVDVRTTAEQFVKEAVANPDASEKKLKGKVVELTGVVSSVNGSLLTVKAGMLKPKDMFGLFVDAELSDAQKAAAAMLTQNQKVQLTGEVKSVTKDRVRLMNCEYKELEASAAPKVTAAELSAAFSKNAADAGKKYGDQNTPKPLFVEGKAGAVKTGEYNTQVKLDAPGKVGLIAIFSKAEGEKIKQGDSLYMKAMCRGIGEDKAVLLSAEMLPTPSPATPAGKK